jgi:hypothetical protein
MHAKWPPEYFLPRSTTFMKTPSPKTPRATIGIAEVA